VDWLAVDDIWEPVINDLSFISRLSKQTQKLLPIWDDGLSKKGACRLHLLESDLKNTWILVNGLTQHMELRNDTQEV